MAMPDFDENGNLPPGIHPGTIAEIKKRYSYNKCRQRLLAALHMPAKHFKAAGCKTLYLDGSFITAKPEPSDYDACWDTEGVDNTIDPVLRAGNRAAIKKRYQGDVFMQLPELDLDFLSFFQTTADGIAKGIVVIDLRKEL